MLATLPAGRVAPAPVEVGLSAMEAAIADARAWMPSWRVDELADEWARCAVALDAAAAAVAPAREVAATTRELDALLVAVGDVVEPLVAFGDAERAVRRRWRVPPSDVPGHTEG